MPLPVSKASNCKVKSDKLKTLARSLTHCLCWLTLCVPFDNRPYKDAYLLTGQIMSIIAFSFSWLWYVTMIFGFPAFIILEVVFCCKMTKGGLVAAIVLSGFAALSSLFAAVYALIKWKDKNYCMVFTLFHFDDDDYWNDDNYYDCNAGGWAALGFIDFLLWTITAWCVLYFLTSGRFEKLASASDNNEQEVVVAVQGIPALEGPAFASAPYAEAAIVPEKAENNV
jgi:hypothetical protein